MRKRFARLADLDAMVGRELAVSDVVLIDVHRGVNHGLNRVGFPAPVPAGSRNHARFEATLEREAGDRPVAIVEAVARQYA